MVKGGAMRATLALVAEGGLRDRVYGRASSAVRALFDDPPLASAWVDGGCMDEIEQILLEEAGVEKLQSISRGAALRGMGPMLRPIVEGLLRVFGASPASLASRAGMIVSQSAKGIEAGYTSTGATSGVLTLRFPHGRPPPGKFHSLVGVLGAFYELSHTPGGTVKGPVMLSTGPGLAAEYHLRW